MTSWAHMQRPPDLQQVVGVRGFSFPSVTFCGSRTLGLRRIRVRPWRTRVRDALAQRAELGAQGTEQAPGSSAR